VFDTHSVVVGADQASIFGVDLVLFGLGAPEVLDVEGVEESEGRIVGSKVGIGGDLVEDVPP
jgi:hypothetical protein